MASYEQEEISTKAKLSKLHCPFTWEILYSLTKQLIVHGNNPNRSDDIENGESCPLELLMKSLLTCYKAVLSMDDDVETKIKEAEELLMLIQQEQELRQIIRAIEHVFYATKCFMLYEAEKTNELEEILENIIDTDDFSNVEVGALNGCQSVVWSYLFDFGMDKAIDTAMKAVEMNPDCALWHFILAKNLRRQRRMVHPSCEISHIEENHFELAYIICDNPVFGVYYLQMCTEKFFKYVRDRDFMSRKIANEKRVLQVAKQILKTKPTNRKVLLKLALIFLRAHSSNEILSAKKCLDEVEKIAPNNPTYLHYMGILYEECGDFRDALKYYKKAADNDNFVAELAYVQYGWETGELEPLPHLLRILKKYEWSVKEKRIKIFLAIATIYYSLHKDIPNAAAYFLKALTADPLNKTFKIFYKFLDFNTPNISNFLKDHFLPEAMRCRAENPALDQTCRKIKDLLNIKNTSDLTEEFSCISVDIEERQREN